MVTLHTVLLSVIVGVVMLMISLLASGAKMLMEGISISDGIRVEETDED